MAKEFNIKNWQKRYNAKRLLQEDYTPKIDDKSGELVTKTMADLGKYFLQISLDLRQGKYQGLTVGEINKIDDLVAAVLNGAMAGNAEAILQRTDKFIEKYVSSPEITDKNKDLATLAGMGTKDSEDDDFRAGINPLDPDVHNQAAAMSGKTDSDDIDLDIEDDEETV